MVSKSNNIEQPYNKSRAENAGSNGSGRAGKKKSVRKSASFFGFLSSQEDAVSDNPGLEALTTMAGAGCMASPTLLHGLNTDNVNNLQPDETGSQGNIKYSPILGINNHSLTAPGSEEKASDIKSLLLWNRKTGSDMLKKMSDIAASLNSGQIRFEKRRVSADSDNPVELIRKLSSEKYNHSNLRGKTRIGEYLDGDGDNFNPLHNSVIGNGEKVARDKAGKTESMDSFIPGGKHEKSFAELLINPDKPQNGLPAGRIKVSSLENYGAYGPVGIEELGRTIFNIVRDAPGQTQYTAKLTLKPESLGTVFVEISMVENTAIINIKAETRETAGIIENHMSSLKDRLSQQGIEAGRIEVSFSPSDNDPMNQNKDNNAGQTPHEERETRRLYANSFRHLRDKGGETGDFKSYVQD